MQGHAVLVARKWVRTAIRWVIAPVRHGERPPASLRVPHGPAADPPWTEVITGESNPAIMGIRLRAPRVWTSIPCQ
jgi:hypothetical protein